ncbi:MAG: hypothetical protein ACP5NG_00300 [Conexivisphaera sp.]
MGQREPRIVERAVKLFSELDSELDKLEADTRAWGKQLIGQADKLSSDARAKLLEEARARAEAQLRAAEEEARARADEILRSEREKLSSLAASFDGMRESLVQLALGMLIPSGPGDE